MTHFQDMTSCYLNTLGEIYHNPDYVCSPRGQKVWEKLNYQFKVENNGDGRIDFKSTGLPERHEIYTKYLEKEHEWYLSGSLLASEAPAKFWLSIANRDGTVNSNYGYMTLHLKRYNTTGELDTGISSVVRILESDQDSRQALLHYNTPEFYYPGNKDVPCTISQQFFIREGFVHTTVNMRSQDIIKGVYDYAWFSYLHRRIRDELQIRSGNSYSIGTYTHNVGSIHLYEKDLQTAQKILNA